jgi:hypothetical protein
MVKRKGCTLKKVVVGRGLSIVDKLNSIRFSTFSPNGNLTITGNEQYVNSSWLVPSGENKYFRAPHTHLLQRFKKLESTTYMYFASMDGRKGCSKVTRPTSTISSFS